MSRRFSKDFQQREKIVKRIQEIVDDTYDFEKEFFDDFKMAPGTYGNLKEKKTLTIEFIIAFSDKFHVNLNWLLRKVGRKNLTLKEQEQPTD